MIPELQQAVSDGNVKLAKRLLRDYGSVLTAADENGDTIMHWAAQLDDARLCQHVLKRHGQLATICNKLGYTPVHVALKDNNYCIVKIFLKSKADLAGLAKAEGLNILQFAAKYCHAHIIRLVLKSLSAKVKEALANEADGLGRTVLHIAAATGSRENMLMLLQRTTADLVRRDARGWLPFHHALINGFYFTAEFLAEIAGLSFESALMFEGCEDVLVVLVTECNNPWVISMVVHKCPNIAWEIVNGIVDAYKCTERESKIKGDQITTLDGIK